MKSRFYANNPFEIPPKIKTVLFLVAALVVAVVVLIVAPTLGQDLGQDVDDLNLTSLSATTTRLTWSAVESVECQAGWAFARRPSHIKM
ncbi:MAG: hypothetical protein ABSF66_16010 [Terriglobales bacterium]